MSNRDRPSVTKRAFLESSSLGRELAVDGRPTLDPRFIFFDSHQSSE